MAFKVLIPYNFTRNDKKALEFVGQNYRHDEQTNLTLFHAYPHVPEIDAKHDPIMEKMKSNVSYLRLQREEYKKALEQARAGLVDFGFTSAQTHCLFLPVKKDVASDIIQLWKQGNFDVIVLNRNPGSIINYFSRSISKRITSYDDGKIYVHIVN